MEKSTLLMKRKPLVVDTTLATLIGLNEAIVLQQIEYWTNANEEVKKTDTFKNGYYWTFSTIEEWNEKFPFWSYSTVKRTLKKLKDNDLVITGALNKKGYDRTTWYRVNHSKLIQLEKEMVDNRVDNHVDNAVDKSQGGDFSKKTNELIENEQIEKNSEEKYSKSFEIKNSSNWTDALGQNELMEEVKMNRPIHKAYNKTYVTSSSSSKKNNTKKDLTHSDICTEAVSEQLIELFNGSICKLRKTTTEKFKAYVAKYDAEFIKSVIEYCEEKNATSFSYFDKTMKNLIKNEIVTVDDFRASLNQFEEKKGTTKSRNTSTKKTKSNQDALLIPSDAELPGTNANDLKEALKDLGSITELSFKTWIGNLELRIVDSKLIVNCANAQVANYVEKKFAGQFARVAIKKAIVSDIEFVAYNAK